MRTFFKLFAVLAIFAVFYAGAFLILQGANEFEKRGDMALFSNKTEAAAIANARSYESQSAVSAPASIWKQ